MDNSLMKATFSSLKHPAFRWYCLGVIASLTGSLMQEIVVAWIAYQMTGSSFVLGSILFCFQIPMLTLGIIGGFAADRFDRKKIIVWTQRAALAVSLTWLTLSITGHLAVWHLYVLSAVFGLIVAFEIPARFAVIPQLVSDEDVMNAFSLDSLLFYSGRVAGPALAAVMLGTLGATACFAVNALTYLFELVTLRRIHPKPREESDNPGLREAFAFAYGNRSIRRLLLMVAVFSFCGVYIPLMPVFTNQLHGNETTNGLLVAASETGAMIGSLILAYVTATKLRAAALPRYVGVAGFSYGIFLALFAGSSSVALSMAMIVPVGFSMTIVLIGSHAMVQSYVEDRMRGVISTVFWMYSYFGMFAIGGPVFGWLVERLGPAVTMQAGAAACVLATALYLYSKSGDEKRI
ncbi:MAG: MFS transporter [Candidatus Melainabacteria bacterium]|nr:MFS transporter [Candidatus Melainabacteria bacterium]